MFSPVETGAKLVSADWCQLFDGDPQCAEIYDHFRPIKGKVRKRFCGVGKSVVLLERDGGVLCILRKTTKREPIQGVSISIYFLKSKMFLADLIKQARDVAEQVWPSALCFSKIKKTDPKHGFLCGSFATAGWFVSYASKYVQYTHVKITEKEL